MNRLPCMIIAVAVLVALLRTMTSGESPPRPLLEVDLRPPGQLAAQAEPGLRLEARRNFPGDAWSQDDDFAARERKWATEQAARLGVQVSEVFRAVDEELHASSPPSPPRQTGAAPCKPRPFYD
ncbi:MAG: hypothetical protein M3Y59_07640 [Myxococcota bacterium]|nr:hypothetical protein [Myxococcota bacterium]